MINTYLVVSKADNVCWNAVQYAANDPQPDPVDFPEDYMILRSTANPSSAWMGWVYDPASETFTNPDA